MITVFRRLLCSFIIITTMASTSLVSNPQVADMAAANTKLTLDLLRECGGGAKKDKNIFLGPYSISTALAMTYMGARGATAEEMKKVLKWASPEAPTQGFGSYLPLLKKSASGAKSAGYVLVGSQRIYVNSKNPMQPEFSASTQEHFTSDAKNANFEGNPEGERKAINDWVSAETNNKIKDLLPEGSIDTLTAMVLVQALYFKGSWVHKFDAQDTRPEDFFAPGGKTRVSMMRQTRNFNHGIFPKLKCAAIELPYAGNSSAEGSHDLSMLIVLPDAQDGLENLEKELTFDALDNIRKNLFSKKVELRLPKFTVESSFALKDVLKKLGMPTAFGPKADFSGMVTGKGAGDLYISQVFHKAVVEVNEEGSEAAAATAVVIMKRSIPIIHPFIADHPFLFFIIDKRGDVVLFSGRVAEPPSVSEGAAKDEL